MPEVTVTTRQPVDEMDAAILRGQQQRQQAALDRIVWERAIVQRAILAEQHPDCFTAEQRLRAETARQLISND